MAKPLKPTNALEGKDKERFLKDLANVRYDKNKERFLNECEEVLKKVQLDLK